MMSRLALLLAVTLLLGVPFLTSCPEGDGGGNPDPAVADDPHAGHDHAEDEAPAVEDDPHAGHDHAAEEALPAEDDPHAGHDHAADVADDQPPAEGSIALSSEQIRELGITTAPAGSGSLGRDLELTGEVAINADAVTHVSPRIGGIIRRVHRKLGDRIQAGAPLLELDSIELAQAKSEYLAILSRVELARETMEREEKLLAKGISAEQDYLAAKQAYEQELISRRATEQQLIAMGLTSDQVAGIADEPDGSLTDYTVRAPVGGEIIEKHASLGEMVDSGTEVFTIGDLSTVWVRLNVYQQDLADVSPGMEVLIDPGTGIEPACGTVDYIEPIIGEETRTAVIRVVLACPDSVFRPGQYVTGYLEVGDSSADLLVPRSAVVDLDQDKLAFVRRGNSFEPRVITVGRRNWASIEVLSGIEPGEDVVVAGAFQLKAELLKGTFDPHAGHAH